MSAAAGVVWAVETAMIYSYHFAVISGQCVGRVTLRPTAVTTNSTRPRGRRPTVSWGCTNEGVAIRQRDESGRSRWVTPPSSRIGGQVGPSTFPGGPSSTIIVSRPRWRGCQRARMPPRCSAARRVQQNPRESSRPLVAPMEQRAVAQWRAELVLDRVVGGKNQGREMKGTGS